MAKHFKLLFIVTFCAFFIQACAKNSEEKTISESSVKFLISRHDKLANAQKTDEMHDLFSEDLLVTIKQKDGLVTVYNKDQFMNLISVLKKVDSYKRDRINESVELSKNGTATHISIASEKINSGGKMMAGDSDEKIKVKLIDGELKIFSYESVAL